KTGEIIDIGVEMGIVERAGTWYSYQGSKLGQGRDNARKFLIENPDVMDDIEAKIMASGNIPQITTSTNNNSSAPTDE
ncbi:MAG: hypothetical protein SFH39_02575, partial [Candidatus Magnetobacterium sp. LHC-1]